MSETWLILETSSRIAKVGLARGRAVVRAVALDDTRRHARDLAATVDAALKAESLKPSDLTGVMVSRGPGSYTGLRVGLMSAKVLAYALRCELRAVETFAAIAVQAPVEARTVCVIADALQGLVYTQRFLRDSDGWRAVDELQIVPFEEWLPIASEAWVSGPGVNVYADNIPQTYALVPEVDREPRIESMFAVGMKIKPLTREEMFALEPLYLRGSSAEEKAKGK